MLFIVTFIPSLIILSLFWEGSELQRLCYTNKSMFVLSGASADLLWSLWFRSFDFISFVVTTRELPREVVLWAQQQLIISLWSCDSLWVALWCEVFLLTAVAVCTVSDVMGNQSKKSGEDDGFFFAKVRLARCCWLKEGIWAAGSRLQMHRTYFSPLQFCKEGLGIFCDAEIYFILFLSQRAELYMYLCMNIQTKLKYIKRLESSPEILNLSIVVSEMLISPPLWVN